MMKQHLSMEVGNHYGIFGAHLNDSFLVILLKLKLYSSRWRLSQSPARSRICTLYTTWLNGWFREYLPGDWLENLI